MMDKQNSDLQSTRELQARLEKVEAKDRSARWWRRTALALLGICASLPFVANALAPVPNTFGDGEVLSAAKMNANFAHLETGVTAVENSVTALEAQPVLASCSDGDVAYKSSGSWDCANVTELLSQKMAWGIVHHNPPDGATDCTVEESSITGVTCTFNAGTFTINTPGWNTHYRNDVLTANASWCGNCDNFGIRVDQLTNTESFLVVLTSYNAGTARVNWALMKQ